MLEAAIENSGVYVTGRIERDGNRVCVQDLMFVMDVFGTVVGAAVPASLEGRAGDILIRLYEKEAPYVGADGWDLER